MHICRLVPAERLGRLVTHHVDAIARHAVDEVRRQILEELACLGIGRCSLLLAFFIRHFLEHGKTLRMAEQELRNERREAMLDIGDAVREPAVDIRDVNDRIERPVFMAAVGIECFGLGPALSSRPLGDARDELLLQLVLAVHHEVDWR